MPSAPLETRTCFFELTPQGFVRATMKQGTQMDLDDAKENVACTGQLAAGRRVPVLVDSRGIKFQTKAAREYLIGPNAVAVSARVALFVGSPVSRLVGNFFLRSHTQPIPTRLFTDEASAIAWLLESPER